MTAFDRAWDLLKQVAPIDFHSDPNDLPPVSEAYNRVIRLLSALDVAMGWHPVDWSGMLKTDRDLLAHLEHGVTERFPELSPTDQQKYNAGMRRTLNEYDRLKSMEGME